MSDIPRKMLFSIHLISNKTSFVESGSKRFLVADSWNHALELALDYAHSKNYTLSTITFLEDVI